MSRKPAAAPGGLLESSARSAGLAQASAPACSASDHHYMGLALAQARRAAAAGEVPVGAVLVGAGSGLSAAAALPAPLAQAHNQPIGLNDPSAHAEMLALRAAALALRNYRLDGCTLYVTLEPCAMCAQAMLHARLARVVFGAPEPKTGAAGSVLDLFACSALNHQTVLQGGVRADECAALLQGFFAQRRAQTQAGRQPLREDALRTPAAAFEPLWLALAGALGPKERVQSRSVHDLPALAGLRLHWVQTAGSAPAGPVWLLLHGPGAWWPQWAQRLAEAAATAPASLLLAPDLIGFGQSDKPKHSAWHSPQRHAEILQQWLQRLGVLAHPGGLHVYHAPGQLALAQALAQRLQGPVAQPLGDGALAPTATIDLLASQPVLHPGLPPNWLDLPFPDAGHRAGPRAFEPSRAKRAQALTARASGTRLASQRSA